MSEFFVGIKLGVLGAALAGSAIGSVKRSIADLGTATGALQARQTRLGDVMARAMTHPARALGGLRQRYDELGRAITAVTTKQKALTAAMERSSTLAQDRARMGGEMMGALGTAAAVGAPVLGSIKQAAGFGDAIKDVAITGNLSGAEELALGKTLRGVSKAVNQTAVDMTKGVGMLIANGMEASKATAQAELLGRFTTATRASFDDAAKMMVSFDLLGVSAKDMNLAFSQAAKAGKLGSFEVRDMAKWFPQLGGYMKGLGVVGNEAVVNMASRLQVAMKTAGSTDEAANNLRNFLAKLTSPDTAKDFGKLGIDLQGSMLRMARQGLDPIEGAVSLVMGKLAQQSPAVAKELEALSAELAGIKDPAARAAELQRRSGMLEALGQRAGMGTMFQDMQAVGYLMAELQNRAELKKIQTQTASGKNDDGKMTLDVDFARRMQSPLEQFKAMKIELQDAAITLGEALLPAVLDLMHAVTPLIKGFATWAKENPGTLRTITGLVVGVTALKVASLGLGWGLNFLVKSPLASLTTAFHAVTARWLLARTALLAGAGPLRALGAAAGLSTGLMTRLGAGMAWVGRAAAGAGRFLLGGLVTGLRVAGQAVLVLGRALLMNPIGLVLTAIAGAAYLIWRNWDKIGPVLGRVWGGMKAGFASAWAWLSGLPARLLTMGGQVVQGLIDGIRAKLGAAGDAIKGLGQTVVSGLKGLLGIHSPSTVFAQLGGFVADGFAGGIGAGLGVVKKGAGAMAAAALVSLPAAALPAINGTAGAAKAAALAGAQAGMTVTFAPVIHVGAGAPAQAGAQVAEAVRISFDEFERLMRRYTQQRARVSP